MKLEKRQDIIKLVKPNGIGIELGVAEGVLSERLLSSNKLSHLYGVDLYNTPDHDVNQYKRALNRTERFRNNYSLLRMSFSEALDLFPDNYFDFIYIDGYAHTGQDDGQTLYDWYPKLKRGGVFSGDDYHPHFPKTVESINKFSKEHNLQVKVINCHEPYSVWSEYPTWYVLDPRNDLSNKSVAIIGNARSLLDKNYGREIDSHDIVIRMNKSPLVFGSYEYYTAIGSKFDIWSVWRKREYENLTLFVPRDTIQMSYWQDNTDRSIDYYPESKYMPLIRNSGVGNPSTGLLTLDWVSHQSPKLVNIYGFDWKETPTLTDIDKNDLYHNFDKEREYCIKYFQQELGFCFNF